MAQIGDFKCDHCGRNIAETPEDPFVITVSVGVTPSHHREYPDIETLTAPAEIERIHRKPSMREEFCTGCFTKVFRQKKTKPRLEEESEE